MECHLRVRGILNLLAAVMSTAAVSSCDKSVTDAEEQLLIRIEPVSSLLTKSPVTGSTFPTSRDIVLSAYYRGDREKEANFFTGVTFSYSYGSVWSADKYWPASGVLDFLGYSLDDNSRIKPVWGRNNSSSVILSFPDNSVMQDDLLVGGSSSNEKIGSSIVFRHALALLDFSAKALTEYDSTANQGITITDIKLEDAKFSGECTVTRQSNSVSCSWSDCGSEKTVSLPGMTPLHLTSESKPIPGSSGILVIPQQPVPFTIYCILHRGRDTQGRSVDDSLSYTYIPAGVWEASKKYSYSITVESDNRTKALHECSIHVTGEIGAGVELSAEVTDFPVIF